MNETKYCAVHESYLKEMDRFKAKYFGTQKNKNGIAIVSLSGSLDDESGMNLLYQENYSNLRKTIEELTLDKDIKGIVLMLNSPGGAVSGCFEACAYLREARNIKPIWAFGENLVASAAYALASSCSRFYTTESTEIGSIGVMAQVADYSAYLERHGIISKIFKSKNAEKKNLPITSEEGANDLQEKLDYYEDKFYEAISLGRDIDRAEALDKYGHGKTFVAPEALEKGMLDEIMSYKEMLNEFNSSLIDESEGDKMDIKKLSAEEREELCAAVLKEDPSLLKKERERILKAERERITALLSIRSDACASIIDEAIANGKSAEAVALDVLKAERAYNAKNTSIKTNAMKCIEEKAQATQKVAVPQGLVGIVSEDEMTIEAIAKATSELSKEFEEMEDL